MRPPASTAGAEPVSERDKENAMGPLVVAIVVVGWLAILTLVLACAVLAGRADGAASRDQRPRP